MTLVPLLESIYEDQTFPRTSLHQFVLIDLQRSESPGLGLAVGESRNVSFRVILL